MNVLHIEAGAHTPLINLNPTTGIMEIRGRSIPDDPEDFWGVVLVWFDEYMRQPCKNTLVKIDLEYFNITSSKRILFLLYKLNELVDAGLTANVEWYYRKSDEDMYEVGQDYAFMVRVPFDHIIA
jgi:SiaC family regulatory phosphoprotein